MHDIGFMSGAWASWIIFGDRGDSLRMRVRPWQPFDSSNHDERREVQITVYGGGSLNELLPLTNQDPVAEGSVIAQQNGIYQLQLWVNGTVGEAYSFELGRVAASPSDSRLTPTGGHATLTIAGDTTSWFAIAPQSLVATVQHGDHLHWAVHTGRHQVALVRDTIYQICQVPCIKTAWITLVPNGAVTWRPIP